MEYGLDKRSNALKIFNTTFIIVWLLVACFPFIWTFWGSFKVRADFFSRADWWYAITAFNTLLETGGKFTTDAYSQAWTEGEFWKASKNTVIVTIFVVSISLFLVLSTTANYYLPNFCCCFLSTAFINFL